MSGIDLDRVAEELAPLAVVARNHAGHCLLIGHGLAHPDLDLAAHPEPAAPLRDQGRRKRPHTTPLCSRPYATWNR
jgi:hypothetical protein